MILIFGIVGPAAAFLGCGCCGLLIPVGGVFSIIAWVMANTDLRAMAVGEMDPMGEGMTNAGRILGIIGVVLSAVALVLTILMVIFQIGMAGAGGWGGPGGWNP